MSLLDPRRHAWRATPTPVQQPAPAAPPAPTTRQPYSGGEIFASGGAAAVILPGATRAQRLEVSAWLLSAKTEEGRADG